LNGGNNFINYRDKLLCGKLEFPNTLQPIFVFFTDVIHFFKVGKVDVIGFDPVGKVMEDLVLEAKDVEYKMQFQIVRSYA
jgi:hypothetical protein